MPGREEFPCNLSILLLKAEKCLRIVHGMPCVMCGSGEKFNSDGKSLRLNGKSTAQRDAKTREREFGFLTHRANDSRECHQLRYQFTFHLMNFNGGFPHYLQESIRNRKTCPATYLILPNAKSLALSQFPF